MSEKIMMDETQPDPELLDLSSDEPLEPPSCNKDDPECEACQ